MSGVVQRCIYPIILLMMLAGCEFQPAVAQTSPPLPKELADFYRQPARPALSGVHLLLDASMSMQGYATSGQESPLRDLISIADEAATTRKVKFTGYSFGEKVAPIGANVENWGKAAAYTAQESRLDLALANIRNAPPGTLSIMASDMWFDNKSFTGTAPVALGQPLRGVLDSGRSVAILGTKVPFAGPVYDMPGGGTWRGGKERVLLLLIAGEERDIRDFVGRLHRSQSPSFASDRTKLSMFNPVRPPKLQSSSLVARGAGVKSRPAVNGVPHFEFDWSDASRRTAPGVLQLHFDRAQLNAGNTAWQGPMTLNTRLWIERNGRWQPWPLKGQQWRDAAAAENVQPFAATFAFGPVTVGPLPEGEYLLAGEIGASSIARNQASTNWVRDWDLPAAPGKPTFVKARGLATLAAILENAVDQPRKDAGFVVRIKVED